MSSKSLLSRLTIAIKAERLPTSPVTAFTKQLRSFQLRDSRQDCLRRLASAGSDQAPGIHREGSFSLFLRKGRWKFHGGRVWSTLARHMEMIWHLLAEPFLDPYRRY